MQERLTGSPADPSENRETSESTHGAPNWLALVESIQRGEPSGMEELFRAFSRGIRFYLCRQLGPQDLDDNVHDTFVTVVEAIRNGELRDPDGLMGFVRTVVRRKVAAQIDRAAQNRRDVPVSSQGNSPDRETLARHMIDKALKAMHERDVIHCDVKLSNVNPMDESAVNVLDFGLGEAILRDEEIAEPVLRSIPNRDRELLARFLMDQTPEEICREMNLSETQFRLLKSRTVARFGGLEGKESNRKNKAAQVQSLDRDISRIVPVIAHTVAVFGDEHKASHWLSTPLPLFANRTPTEVLEGEGGIEAVEQILIRIEHNIPS